VGMSDKLMHPSDVISTTTKDEIKDNTKETS